MRGERASRLSVRPTARGWQALVIGLFVLAGALLVGTTQLYQLAYALLVLVVAALVLGLVGSRGLQFSRELPVARLTAGNPARMVLRVLGGSRFGSPEVEVVDRLPETRSFEVSLSGGYGGAAVGSGSGGASHRGGEGEIEAPVAFARRGIYELGPAEVRATDPFALLRFARGFGGRTEVVVYPQVHALPGFPVRGGGVETETRGSRGRRGDEFAGLREYRRGDDRRHIHWKSVARTGELVVKEFALHAPQRYTVALDLRRGGLRVPEREVDDAVSAAGSVLAHLAGEKLPFRLVCTDREGHATGFGSDEAAYWGAMRILATARADGNGALGEAVYERREELGEGVVLVSRTRDGGLPESVGKLRRAGLSVIVVALAAHTYRSFPGEAGRGVRDGGRDPESEFSGELGRLEAAGAEVLVLRHPGGVPGLAGAGAREAGR